MGVLLFLLLLFIGVGVGVKVRVGVGVVAMVALLVVLMGDVESGILSPLRVAGKGSVLADTGGAGLGVLGGA